MSEDNITTASRTVHPFSLPSQNNNKNNSFYSFHPSRVELPETSEWNARAFVLNNFLSPIDCKYEIISSLFYFFQ